jgi:hypothetical protein
LAIDRRFVQELDQRLQKDPAPDPLDPALWENFIAVRRDIFDYTALNLRVLAKDQKDPERLDALSLEESQIKEELLTSLTEMAALEEKLTSYLADNLTLLKETIDDLAKGQTLFSGYASLETQPNPTRLDSLA